MVWPDEIDSEQLDLHIKEWKLLGYKVARQTGFVLIMEFDSDSKMTTCVRSYSYAEESDLWKGTSYGEDGPNGCLGGANPTCPFGEEIEEICYEWDGDAVP